MSSTKKITRPFPVLKSADMTTSHTSLETDVRHLDYARILAAWSGASPVGTLQVQALRDDESEVWVAVDFGADGTALPISGNADNHDIVFSILPFARLRCVYTPTSGTGTLNIYLMAKEG